MEGWYLSDDISYPDSRVKFQPDWQAYYDACDKDEPIMQLINLFEKYWYEVDDFKVSIWSSRSSFVREKTIEWLRKNINISHFRSSDFFNEILKMRPIGNTEPAHVLKERWLDEFIENWSLTEKEKLHGMTYLERKIEMVFDADPESIAMWKRRGVFVFDCRQE